ncbi:Major facilitator family transporter [Xenorhabdus nematophila ATCC 19061]|uniref:Major facilitator family transporter n=1 Tax=Xenorhabdus nematophila (strain ATCC 19061 / DSM 3370 / CCUG 14189 / LMG 1036 / NCIMB 9965 / AN6) TaxID=406817 RepID=D3VLB8_XENNA|nr:MFS transporter [Xenorhabdus nematophila]CBJ89077.1 Major facilitator family transporter [Xenorhabdus nematophila ATCC 19061]CEE91097.1 Major facilitator family transporter [Xenorhabdus nematophila str. Anatoliense]CEE93529.1 Major facilitator family transporter [Xenorhabdus nematophila str. Anatoliense]CEK21984.1 Major facilitator family transporter [Xenorhabdus nematophila AN6/1]
MSSQENSLNLRWSGLNALLIVSARFVSDFGAFLNMVALSTYVYLLSNSVMHVSIFLACRVAGGLIASLIGTPFFRRFTGRWPLVFFDLIRVILLSLLLVIPVSQQLLILPIIAFGIGLGNSMFAIGLNSQLPYWVHASRRISTNSWLTSVAATGAVFGSLVSGLLVATSGYEMVFTVNIMTYLLAAILIMPLHFLSLPEQKTSRELSNEWRELRLGLRSAPMLAGMLFLSLADTLGSAAHNVGFPIISELLTPDNASTTMGLLLATWAIGKFSGARLTSYLLRNRDLLKMEKLFFIGVALMSTGFILTFQQNTVFWLLLFAIWAGIGDGIAEVSLISRVQSEPESLRLPIFSLLTLLQMTGFGIGMLLVAPFYIWLPPSIVILIFHGLPLTVLVLVLFWVRRITAYKA